MDDNENVFLFDLDGSLADHDEALIRDLEHIRGPNEPVVNRDALWKLDDIAHMKARVDLIRKVPGWWRNLKPIDLGFQIYHLAQSFGFVTEVLTKGPKRKSLAWKEKVDWCLEHLGDTDVHIVTNKGRFYGKVLYDDYPLYMEKWLQWRHRGLGIMPLYDSNKDFDHPNVLFWDGEKSTLGLIRTALHRVMIRKPNESLNIADLKDLQKERFNEQKNVKEVS